MRKTKNILSIFIAFIVSFTWVFTSFDQKVVFAQSGVLEAHFLDVGQGDCAIINMPDGKTMIVDAGDNKNAVKDKILDYIDANFPELEYFDFAIVTHEDADHCGGMAAVLQEYPAKTVYRPNVIAARQGFIDPVIAITQDHTVLDDNLKLWNETGAGVNGNEKETLAYKNFIAQAYEPFLIDGTPYTPQVIVSDGRKKDRPENKASQDIIGEDYSVIFYSPLRYTYTDANDYSNIFILEFQGFEFFFSGDAEAQAEQEFVEEYFDYDFDIDVFKLGHHGSRTSSSQELIELVTKQSKRDEIRCVISCGEGNSYNHPHQEALDRFISLGFLEENILRTDQIGDIVFEVKPDLQGNYSLYCNGQKISGDDFWQKLFKDIQEFFMSLYDESPQLAYLAIAVIIIFVIIAAALIIKSRQNKKSKK
ncbi:MAG: MBL fold metallo-hydrolase [Clostridiales bacterium]|mgnify:CR=1 FL=1|nr:MBL fold metallo-hydrolase [Clostridiales bacterium]